MVYEATYTRKMWSHTDWFWNIIVTNIHVWWLSKDHFKSKANIVLAQVLVICAGSVVYTPVQLNFKFTPVIDDNWVDYPLPKFDLLWGKVARCKFKLFNESLKIHFPKIKAAFILNCYIFEDKVLKKRISLTWLWIVRCKL